jgi:hypothetical protein
MQSQETARSLYRRSQHGNVEALRALLLSTADGLYSAALAASANETHAQELVVQTWEAFLAGLGRGKPKETAELRLQRTLGLEITFELDAAAAERAVRLWAESDGQDLLHAPGELVEHLEELSQAMAATIQRRAVARRVWVWAGRAALAAALGALLVLGAEWGEQLAEGHARQIEFTALRQQAQAERLSWAVRDALLDLPDPEGADRDEAAMLSQIALLLEDLIASPELGGSEQLHNLQARLVQGDLLWRLREATMDAPETQRHRLARVGLLLEEAAVL